MQGNFYAPELSSNFALTNLCKARWNFVIFHTFQKMLCHFFLPFLMRICAGQLLMNGLRSLQTFISITLLAEETDKKKLYHKSPVNIEPTSFLIFLWIIAKEKVISEIDDGEEQKYFILFCDKCWKCIQLFKFRGKLHRKRCQQ